MSGVSELPQYFRYPRADVLALVPLSATRILDVGCAAGRVGAALKERQRCEVAGIERDPVAARAARAVLDEVIEADLDDLAIDWTSRLGRARFDCLIYADILEHLRDPWRLLASQRELLAPGGHVVVSLPNVRHYPVVLGLLRGRWRYQDEGVLDRSHLRFFTRDSARELVSGAGYRMVEIAGEEYASSAARAVNLSSLGLLRDFLVRQHLLVATR